MYFFGTRQVAMEYTSVWVVLGNFKGMCETSSDKNVSSEDTCFGIRSEIAAGYSRTLSYSGTIFLIVFLNSFLNQF